MKELFYEAFKAGYQFRLSEEHSFDWPKFEEWYRENENKALAIAGVGGSAIDANLLIEKLQNLKDDPAFKGVISHGYPREINEVIEALECVK